jgi:hypothetical protein
MMNGTEKPSFSPSGAPKSRVSAPQGESQFASSTDAVRPGGAKSDNARQGGINAEKHSENNTQQSWYYENRGSRIGAISEPEMIYLIKTRKLDYGSIVWRQGFVDWMPIESTELKIHLSGPPPITGTNVNNTLIWLVAFAPIMGNLLEGMVAYLVVGNYDTAMSDMHNQKYWYITLALNSLLCWLDEKYLARAGINTDKFNSILVYFLVPFYIIKRTKVLKQSYIHFIVWVAALIVTVLFI